MYMYVCIIAGIRMYLFYLFNLQLEQFVKLPTQFQLYLNAIQSSLAQHAQSGCQTFC